MSQFCCPSLPLSPSAWSPPELTAEYCSQSHDSFLSSFSLVGSLPFLTAPWTFFVSVSCPPGKCHVGDTWSILLHVLGGRQYQGIQLNELFRGGPFPFLPFLPFAKPCTELPARHCQKGPSQPFQIFFCIRCKALLKHQLGRCHTAGTEGNLQSHPWPFQISPLESISGPCG